jgi:hypothetical protein
MQPMKMRFGVVLLVLSCLTLVACNASSAAPTQEQPAKVETIEGTEFNRITLTEKTAERLGIESESLREETVNGTVVKVVPYAAIIYGLQGEQWVYIRMPDENSLTFVRVPVTVEFIVGDLALLSAGPDAGVEVVTVGVVELYGVDIGVDK